MKLCWPSRIRQYLYEIALCLKNADILLMNRWWVGWLVSQKFLHGSLLQICRRWQHFGVTKSPNVQLGTASVSPNYLEGVPGQSLFFHLVTNFNARNALKLTACLEPSSMSRADKRNGAFSEWVRRMVIGKEHNPIMVWYRIRYVELFFLQRPWNLGKMHRIMDSMKYHKIISQDQVAPVKKEGSKKCNTP